MGEPDNCRCPKSNVPSVDSSEVCTDSTGVAHANGDEWRNDDCTSCVCRDGQYFWSNDSTIIPLFKAKKSASNSNATISQRAEECHSYLREDAVPYALVSLIIICD